MLAVECNPDVVLVRCLGVKRQEIKHPGGKEKVIRLLKRNKCSRGMVDEDPHVTQSRYVSNLREVGAALSTKKLIDEDTGCELIVLCPRLEEWILEAAEEAGVDVGHMRYNLPKDPHRLHSVINMDPRKLERLIEDIKGKSNMMKGLRKYLLQ